MAEKPPIRADADAVRGVGSLGEPEGVVGALREELRPIVERLERIENTQAEHGERLEHIEMTQAEHGDKLNAIDGRLSDVARAVRDLGGDVADDPPEEAAG